MKQSFKKSIGQKLGFYLFAYPLSVNCAFVDGDVPYTGKIYEAMDQMIGKIRSIQIDIQDERTKEKLVVGEVADSNWNQYSSPLYATKHILDLVCQHEGFALMANNQVVRGWNEILPKMVPMEERRKMRDALK